MKVKANTTVKIKPYKAPLLSLAIKAWWLQVSLEAPMIIKRIVLSNGKSVGAIASIPIGGHCRSWNS